MVRSRTVIMTAPLTRESLSYHDCQILESIFNPLEFNIGPNSSTLATPDEDDLIDIFEGDCGARSKDHLAKAQKLESEGVRLAEGGQLNDALEHFSSALILAPKLASVYNNRAQAFRLADRTAEALEDLNEALKVSTDQQRKTKCAAYCQRGILYRKQENLESARADFEKATELGSRFARTQLVEINPYAALCSTMLRQAFDRLK